MFLPYLFILCTCFVTAQEPTPNKQQTIKEQLIHDTFHAIVTEGKLPDLSFNKETDTYAYKGRLIQLSIKDFAGSSYEDNASYTYFNLNSDAPFDIVINKNLKKEKIKVTLLHELAHILDSERLQETNENFTRASCSLPMMHFIRIYISEYGAEKRAIFSALMTIEDLQALYGTLLTENNLLPDKNKNKDRAFIPYNDIAEKAAANFFQGLTSITTNAQKKPLINAAQIIRIGWIQKSMEHKINHPNTPYRILDEHGNVGLRDELAYLQKYICKKHRPKDADEQYAQKLFCENYQAALRLCKYAM